MGTQPRPQKGARPQFSAHVYCGQTAVCIKIPLGVEVDLSLGDIVLDADPAPPSLKGTAPQFLAIVSCGQTPGWTKMPLGTEVGLGLRDIVFVDPRKRHTHPNQFLAYVYFGQTAGWMKTPLGMEDLSPGHIVLDGVPAPARRTTYKNSSGDEIAKVNLYAVRPEATRIR